jgi:putative transposase
MFLSYKFRLYPTEEQEEILISWSHINRYIWNYFLEQNIEKYNKEKKFIFFFEMSKLLPKLKQSQQFLQEVPACTLQHTCKQLDITIKRSYKLKLGFPKFKPKKQNKLLSFYIPQTNNQIKWTKTNVIIPKLGKIKWKKSRKLKGKLKSITIKYEGNNWYCSVLVESNKEIKPILDQNNTIGIDLGIKNFIITSNNEIFNLHPKLFEKEQKIDSEQKKLSKKKKGSKNRLKQIKKLRAAYTKIRFARIDNAHKISTSIAKKYSGVAIEDLNIKSMMKNHNLSKKISRASWYQIIRLLDYKTNVVNVNRFYPSSKICSHCGNIQKIPLNIRTYDCINCGMSIDRDLNAAINIKNITFVKKGNYACGDASNGDINQIISSYVSLNQEKFETDIITNIFGLEY